ncbi:MAG: nitrate reductase cytochrome c-type subunit [Polyangiaceae bacterium]
MSERRTLYVGTTAVITVAFAGLLSGIRASGMSEPVRSRPSASSVLGLPPRSYSDMRGANYGPNRAVYDESRFQALLADRPGLMEDSPSELTARSVAREKRRARRAYDGAPPTIPHRIEQLEHPDCLACHESGVRVGELTAPMMSHRELPNCVQCHVVADDPLPFRQANGLGVTNSFVGLTSPGSGTRAYSGSPPTIPHKTTMREKCESCHGVLGAFGLRTPHPDRQNCQQCHVGSRELDQSLAPRQLGPGGALP